MTLDGELSFERPDRTECHLVSVYLASSRPDLVVLQTYANFRMAYHSGRLQTDGPPLMGELMCEEYGVLAVGMGQSEHLSNELRAN